MNLKLGLWLYWGIPSAVLGTIIMLVTGAPVTVAMPIAGTLVVVVWAAILLSGKTTDETRGEK